MPSFDPQPGNVLFLIVSGCKGALHTADRCEQLVAAGHRVNVITTPTAAGWVDSARIEAVTGWPPRSEMRTPAEPTFEPYANAVLASPVSLNTLTKWADGHADNLAVGLLCEALGMGIPITAEVQLSPAFAAHPATAAAINRLRSCGVQVQQCDGGAPLPESLSHTAL